MKKEELITELKKLPDDIEIIGFHHGNYAPDIEITIMHIEKDETSISVIQDKTVALIEFYYDRNTN